MKVKVSIGFAIAAFIMSALIGIIIDNTVINLLIKSVSFAVLFFFLSFGSWTFLEKRVPEIFELQLNGLEEGRTDLDDGESPGASFEESEEGGTSYEPVEGEASPAETAAVGGNNQGPQSGMDDLGDHIIIRDKKFKNEPKLIADAIKQMMDQEEE